MYRILICAVVAFFVGSQAEAQEKQHISFKVPGENSKVIQQHNVEVGDVPNHIARVYEARYTFPNNVPIINGVKLIELWNRGTTDLTDGHGTVIPHHISVMENGDKFFANGNSVVQTAGEKLSAIGVLRITGGTGKFATMQGVVRQINIFDLKGNTGESQFDIEYSIGK